MSAANDAWQGALAAEHRAVFGYGLLGPQLSGTDRSLADSCASAHEALRDATTAKLAAAGQTPVSAEADYPDLYPVSDPAAARRLALHLEEHCARAWRYLYLQAGSRADLRTGGQASLTASAVRAVRWRQLVTPQRPLTPFPGL